MKICSKCGHRHFKRTDDGKCHCGETVFWPHRAGMVPFKQSDGRKFDGNYQFHQDQNH